MKNKKKCIYAVMSCLLAVLALSLSSCSDSSSEPDEQEHKWGLTGYEYFKEKGGINRYTFDICSMLDIDYVMYGTWNRDSVVAPNGEKTKVSDCTIEISKNSLYAQHSPKGDVTHRIKKWEIKDKSLLLTLSNDSVVRYDSIVWNIDQCCLVSRGSKGELFKDYRQNWANSEDMWLWCLQWGPRIY